LYSKLKHHRHHRPLIIITPQFILYSLYLRYISLRRFEGHFEDADFAGEDGHVEGDGGVVGAIGVGGEFEGGGVPGGGAGVFDGVGLGHAFILRK